MPETAGFPERKDVAAIILARQGSKRLKDKNIQVLGNCTLLEWAIHAAHESKAFANVYVSTDSQQYAEIADAAGALAIRRPPELATDESTSESGIAHVLQCLVQIGVKPIFMALMQPTSPFTQPETVARTVRAVVKGGFDTAMSICVQKKKPWWSWVRSEDGHLTPFIMLPQDSPYLSEVPPPTYQPTGGVYCFRTAFFEQTGKIYGGQSYGVVVDEVEGIDIDSAFDLAFASHALQSHSGPNSGPKLYT